MARGRMINKRLCKSKKFAKLKNDRSRVIYVLTYIHADCEGKIEADPEELKLDCVPYLKYSVKKVAESMVELHNVDLGTLYEIENKAYFKFSDFKKNQPGIRFDREAPSAIPDPIKGRSRSGVTPSLYLKLNLNLRKEGRNKDIYFDFEKRQFFNITEEDKKGWKEAYSACNIDVELKKMREWLLANPEKKKKNYRRFIINWLSKTQDHGGTKSGASGMEGWAEERRKKNGKK